mgnify:FL=1
MKWLDEHNLPHDVIDLVKNTPSKEELLELMKISEFKPRQFFNTRGRVYRERQLKDKAPNMTAEEIAEELSTDGMLIKRPIVTDGDKVTIGFNEETFTNTWKK